jgi:hypothetical protein
MRTLLALTYQHAQFFFCQAQLFFWELFYIFPKLPEFRKFFPPVGEKYFSLDCLGIFTSEEEHFGRIGPTKNIVNRKA